GGGGGGVGGGREGGAWPAIWLIEREARWNASPSLILCFSSLWLTASINSAATASSLAPERIGRRRSHSSTENRHVRSCPSAVSRMRLHCPQNGCETGLMKPISPMPSANVKRREGLLGSAATGTRDMKSRSRIALISPPLSTRSRCQLPSASNGMNSMKRIT